MVAPSRPRSGVIWSLRASARGTRTAASPSARSCVANKPRPKDPRPISTDRSMPTRSAHASSAASVGLLAAALKVSADGACRRPVCVTAGTGKGDIGPLMDATGIGVAAWNAAAPVLVSAASASTRSLAQAQIPSPGILHGGEGSARSLNFVRDTGERTKETGKTGTKNKYNTK